MFKDVSKISMHKPGRKMYVNLEDNFKEATNENIHAKIEK